MPPSAEPLPFAELLDPLADDAMAQLERTAAADLTDVDPAALADARAALLRRLSWLAAPQLYARMVALRAAGGGYADFAARHRGAGWARFLEPLPELERLLGVVVDTWVSALAELLARLRADRPQLAAVMGGDAPTDALTGLRWPASDLHRGGRAVAVLAFADGRQVVYKPRDVRAELAFGDLVHALADASGQLPMRTPAVDVRDGYGWVEHVAAVACTGPAAAERYHRRAGVLAALFHALGSRDMHQDNVLSCGEHPIVVDAETVLRADAGAADPLAGGVLESLLLPRWMPVRRERMAAVPQGAEMGALGAGGGVAAAERWSAIDTDRMGYAIGPRTLPASTVRPHVDGRPVVAADHLDALRSSFTRAYRVLAHWGPDLLGPGGAGQGLAQTEVRVLHRTTSAYHALLYAGRRRECLAATATRDERLRAGLATAAGPHEPALEEAELPALRDMDVPIFTVPAIDGPLRTVAARLAALDDDDLARQDGLLRAALARPWPSVRKPRPDGAAGEPLDAAGALAEAQAIGEEIAAAAVERGGGVTWIGVRLDAPTGHPMTGPIGAGLHGGGLGVALFLAELAAQTGDERWRRLAGAAAAAARARTDVDRLDLGLADGIGGRVLGLTRLAGLLDDRSLLDDAAAWASEVTPQRLERDACHDLLRGGAGAVVGLVALHAATGDAAYLDTALAECRRFTGAPGAALALALAAGAAGDRMLAATALASHNALGAVGIPGWSSGDAGHAVVGLAIGAALERVYAGARRARADALTAISRVAERPVDGVDDSLSQGEAVRIEALLSAGHQLGRPEFTRRAHEVAADVLAGARAEDGLRLIGLGVPNRLAPGLLCGTAGVGFTLLRLAAPDAVAPLLGSGARAPVVQRDEAHADELTSPASALPLDFV